MVTTATVHVHVPIQSYTGTRGRSNDGPNTESEDFKFLPVAIGFGIVAVVGAAGDEAYTWGSTGYTVFLCQGFITSIPIPATMAQAQVHTRFGIIAHELSHVADGTTDRYVSRAADYEVYGYNQPTILPAFPDPGRISCTTWVAGDRHVDPHPPISNAQEIEADCLTFFIMGAYVDCINTMPPSC